MNSHPSMKRFTNDDGTTADIESGKDENLQGDKLLLPLPSNLKTGDTINISGTILEDAKMFSLALVQSRNDKGVPDNVPYLYKIDFDEGIATSSYKTGGLWAAQEDVIQNLPLKRGEAFAIDVTIYDNRFNTNINNTYWRKDRSTSGLVVNSVEIWAGLKWLKHIGFSIDENRQPSDDFKSTLVIPQPLKSGNGFHVSGKIADDANVFTVALVSDRDRNDNSYNAPYQLIINFHERKATIDHRVEGDWLGAKQIAWPPIERGENFSIDITMFENRYDTRINQNYWRKDQLDYDNPNGLSVAAVDMWDGMKKLEKVRYTFENVPTSDTVWVDIPQILNAGSKITLTGIVALNAGIVSISLVQARDDDGKPYTMPYYYKMNFDDEKGVFNTKYQGVPGEVKDVGFPSLGVGEPFTIEITIFEDRFETRANETTWTENFRNSLSGLSANVVEVSDGLNDLAIKFTF